MKRKTTYVKLVCDRDRIHSEDALFTIVKDIKGLGDVVCFTVYLFIYLPIIFDL